MPKKQSRSRTPAVRQDSWRIPKSITLDPDQDRWIAELIGEEGNVSELLRSLIDAARSGGIDPSKLQANQKPRKPGEQGTDNPLDRAVEYIKAKEAGLRFEEDVTTEITRTLQQQKETTVSVRQRQVFNGAGGTFVADTAIFSATNELIVSVVCKSSPRLDKLDLALMEAVIGRQKTHKPVVVVIPYLLPEAQPAIARFKALEMTLCDVESVGLKITETVKEYRRTTLARRL